MGPFVGTHETPEPNLQTPPDPNMRMIELKFGERLQSLSAI